MKKVKRNRFWKFTIGLTIGFLILLIFRIIYGYTNDGTPQEVHHPIILADKSFEFDGRKNYASIKYTASNQSPSSNLDQKYEKIATARAISHEFDQEENQIRKQIKKLNGLIQFENKSGNEGFRRLDLSIGVPPENFDQLFQNLIKIGKIQAKEITKKDKTNEYRELNARKSSLEKIRASLVELKSKGGKINEYMLLENRILEIEQQLQELGVSLGNFDDENEFCTIKFTLSESPVIKIGFLKHITNALKWTIETYLMTMAAFAFMSLFAYLALLIIEKLKIKE
ncbi:DUF4349 domain-containing protein [Flagellimonas sp. 389]|uniref:DUF4349 domain-containing protein n=1 Tax=Flagellimonas sp. 389 TaxID=2835862 RepID=UPI001BD50094|nr:DUF4349 domain-containing protein [Flagellimonas sp. 389]MBS9460784.1 DUF4349 domain-containing protein [Flagellimonas sp. 389]